MTAKGIIAHVVSGSIAQAIGLVPGDRILAVNGTVVTDIIDLSYALADEYVELLIEKQDNQQEIHEVEKEEDDDLGIEFESAVFDHIRQCSNSCIFCFVKQLPPGMRTSLYVKDDDYRLSFLYGNFITLTNLTKLDMERIRRLHLSPLYVSVHSTAGHLRAKMLDNPKAANISSQLAELIAAGVELHTQIVLCPGWNDGPALEQTITDLYDLGPQILSLAIVPVGLTGHRDNCSPIESVTPTLASEVITQVTKWQQHCRQQRQGNFVYLADEFYLLAGLGLPAYEEYDEFPQLENGVGIVRSFLQEWSEIDFSRDGNKEVLSLDVVCGQSAAKILEHLLQKTKLVNMNIRLVPVENMFFGKSITVSGLLTGQDIIAALDKLTGPRDGVIIPGVALRKGERIFLDGLGMDDIEAAVGVPVRAAYFAADLGQMLRGWR